MQNLYFPFQKKNSRLLSPLHIITLTEFKLCNLSIKYFSCKRHSEITQQIFHLLLGGFYKIVCVALFLLPLSNLSDYFYSLFNSDYLFL